MSNAPRFEWNKRHDAVLLRGYKKRRSWEELAAEIGCSVRVIQYRLSLLRKRGAIPDKFRAWDSKELDLMVKLYNRSLPLLEIAKKLGRSPGAISSCASRLRRRGVKLLPLPRSGRPCAE